MSVFHAALFFSHGKDWGWVEQFFRQDSDLRGALTAAQRLAQARYSILGAGVNLSRVRVSQVGFPKAVASSAVSGRTLAAPAMEPIQAMDVRLQSAGSPTHWRNYPLRGFPRNGVERAGVFWRWAPSLASAGPAWLNLLVRDGWCLQVEETVGAELPILGINEFALQERDLFGDPLDETDPDPTTTFCVAVLAGAPPAGFPSCKVRSVAVRPNFPQYRKVVNGTHPVSIVVGNAVFWHGTLGGAEYVGGGFLRMVQPGYVPIASSSLVRLVGRKCGPPTEEPEFNLTSVPTGSPVSGPIMASPPLDLPPVPVGPPPPPLTTIQTARDLAQLIWQGYSPPGPSPALGIGIGQVAGRDRPTYLVVLAGIDNEMGQTTKQWANAIASAVGIPDQFTNHVRTLIRTETPEGAEIILGGHSFGGMVADWMASLIPSLGGGRSVTSITNFGSPFMNFGFTPAFNRYFAVRGDLLTYGPPLGNYTWLNLLGIGVAYYSNNATERLLGAGWFGALTGGALVAGYISVDAGDTPLDPYARHMCYPDLTSLEAYNWKGIADPEKTRPPLVIGEVKRFSWLAPN